MTLYHAGEIQDRRERVSHCGRAQAMPNPAKMGFLNQLRERYGALHKLPGSQSLYEVGSGAAIVYIRYSKLHDGPETWNGPTANAGNGQRGQRACHIGEA